METYESAVMEVVYFESEDIITSSNELPDVPFDPSK